jgi:hypothetical protein
MQCEESISFLEANILVAKVKPIEYYSDDVKKTNLDISPLVSSIKA